MERFMLIQQLTDFIDPDIINIICKHTIEISEFIYGRMYQLVIDRTCHVYTEKQKKQERGERRRDYVLKYIKLRTKYEIVKEALDITKYFSIKSGNNEWNKLFSYDCDYSFYIGRSLQFILDTNNKICLNDIIKLSADSIKRLAHDMKANILKPSEFTRVHIRRRICECQEYHIGDDTCLCGDVEMTVEFNNFVYSLDNTDLDYEVYT